ncbi:MAG: neutral zinc metallopeptidase [Pseudomonadota bacterium]
MRWRGRRRSANVDDRRNQGAGGMPRGRGRGRMRIPGIGRSRTARRAGGGGIGFIIVVLIVAWFLGINPLTLLQGGLQGGNLPLNPDSARLDPGAGTPAPAANDEMKEFISVVLAETEDVWNRIFRQGGAVYEEPTLVLFSGQVRSACGFASAATGPFYCPGDKKVYIDLSFYDELRKRFEAPGDFAQAYVVAHEIGHHVQNLIGVLPEFNRRRAQMSETERNQMSVRVELQADCFAGIWGYHAKQRGILEAGDLEEALNAATQIGDDAIQKRLQGFVVPESFNHGTSEQRRRWFKRGFDTGDMSRCDTFRTQRL